MIILSSPAKTQDFKTEWSSVVQTLPEFLKDASQIVEVVRGMSKTRLARVMKISPQLTDLNYERYQQWSIADHKKSGKPAILAYRGDIFKQMYPTKYTKEQQLYAHHSIRFLTGLYGMLRAYDLMLPYRLEMNAHVAAGGTKDLFKFWEHKLTASLNRDLSDEKDPLLVDAASGEYSTPIDFGAIKYPWVRIEFREKEEKGLRNVGIFSKKARGVLLEYCIVNQVNTREELKKFNQDGYTYLRETKNEIMFVR